MEIRVLGAHNMESLNTRMEGHLIDGVLALDAGGLTRALTFEEQRGIRAVILSHRHFDHVRDILPLGLFIRGKDVTIDLYAIQDTIDFISEKLLDGSLYPDFLRTPSPERPAFRLNVVDFHKEYDVLGYRVKAVPVPHAVPPGTPRPCRTNICRNPYTSPLLSLSGLWAGLSSRHKALSNEDEGGSNARSDHWRYRGVDLRRP